LPDDNATYRIAFESSGDAIMFLDRDGFLDCNQTALDIYGLTSKKDIIGKHPGEMAPLL
jgi:PAS domain S-box-containing protein